MGADHSPVNINGLGTPTLPHDILLNVSESKPELKIQLKADVKKSGNFWNNPKSTDELSQPAYHLGRHYD